MTFRQEIKQMYSEVNARTCQQWSDYADSTGLMKNYRYHLTNLAIVTGFTPEMPESIKNIINGLNNASSGDSLVDILSIENFHFTFLAITDHIYQTYSSAGNIDELIVLFNKLTSFDIKITELQLVALPEQILLAGVPDQASYEMRKQFTQSILNSAWAREFKARYNNIPLPPPWWHSTLCRYKKERLPENIRHYFFKHQGILHDEISGPLRLVMTDYKWSHVYDISTG